MYIPSSLIEQLAVWDTKFVPTLKVKRYWISNLGIISSISFDFYAVLNIVFDGPELSCFVTTKTLGLACFLTLHSRPLISTGHSLKLGSGLDE